MLTSTATSIRDVDFIGRSRARACGAVYRWITRDTRKEAEAALAAANVSVRKGEYVAPTDRTLTALYENWRRLCVEGADNKHGKPCSPRTAAFYAGT
ncbi:MAG: hypothetical protein JWO52_1438 [Gammaproteobacteria bacterium]|nr:hypothetical protein [Gammaproteobacteria bacterium]